jgi:hypothetical protein
MKGIFYLSEPVGTGGKDTGRAFLDRNSAINSREINAVFSQCIASQLRKIYRYPFKVILAFLPKNWHYSRNIQRACD